MKRAGAASLVVTVEDGFVHGGAGQYLRAELERAAAIEGVAPPTVLTLGVPAVFVPHGSPDDILASFGLDARGVAASTTAAYERLQRGAAVARLDALPR